MFYMPRNVFLFATMSDIRWGMALVKGVDPLN
jgi:hypothetical protein